MKFHDLKNEQGSLIWKCYLCSMTIHQSWVRGEKSEAVSPKTGPNSDHSVRHSGQDIEEIFSGPGHEALRQQCPRGAYTASRTLYPDREAGGERGQ